MFLILTRVYKISILSDGNLVYRDRIITYNRILINLALTVVRALVNSSFKNLLALEAGS